jgi:hypothetical protein
MKLGNHLFWDTDPAKVDPEKHARKIIERVVTRGRLEDWFMIRSYYGLDRIKQEALQIRSLDDKTLVFLSTVLKIPKTEFRCYSNRLSNQPHFPY